MPFRGTQLVKKGGKGHLFQVSQGHTEGIEKGVKGPTIRKFRGMHSGDQESMKGGGGGKWTLYQVLLL